MPSGEPDTELVLQADFFDKICCLVLASVLLLLWLVSLQLIGRVFLFSSEKGIRGSRDSSPPPVLWLDCFLVAGWFEFVLNSTLVFDCLGLVQVTLNEVVFLFSESAIKVEVLLICVAFFRCLWFVSFVIILVFVAFCGCLCFHRFGFLVG